jgi:hypothetical protein
VETAAKKKISEWKRVPDFPWSPDWEIPGPNTRAPATILVSTWWTTWPGTRNCPWKKARFAQAEVCRLENGTWLLKPMTFMNASGDAVADCLAWFRFRTAQLLVVGGRY